MRRSFRASPFPGKTTRADSGDKENNKDQISDAVKALPKSAKNFMSPTISAVSKINPSPRKKILSDKNELSRSFDKTIHHHQPPQVRSSVTFSDVVSFIGEETKDQDQIFISEKKKLDEEESHDDVTVTDMDDYSSFDVSPLPTSVPYTFPVFESREVDPSVTPYDPKKNYLSPRPQFLHYRPNPRIECKQQLDGLFSSDSSSSTDDTDSSAEESRHEEEEEEEVVSQESVGEEEAVESQQVEKVASEEEAEERQHVEEVTCQEGVVAVEEEEEAEVTLDEYDDEEHLEAVESEEEEETHQVSKRSRFKTSKLLGWVLVLGVAYTLLVSSVTLKNIKEGSDFYDKFNIPPEVTKSARESFEQLSEKLGMWAGSSLVYMDKLISSLIREEEEEGYGPFQFHNLTGVLEETRLSDTVFQPASGKINFAGSQVNSQDWSLEMDTEEENVVHQEPEAVYEEDGNEMEKESEGGEANSEMVYEVDKKAEITMATDPDSISEEEEEEESVGQETDGVEEQREYEENDQKNLEEGHESETTTSAQNDEKMMEESESNAHQLDDVESAAISVHQQEEASELANLESVPEEGGTEETAETSLDVSAETSDVDGNDLEEESGIGEEVSVKAEDWKEVLLSNQKKVMVLVSTVMVMLAAAAAFILANKKAKPAMHEENEPTAVPAAKEHAPVEDLIKERLSTLNFQEEEEEEVNDDRKREEVSSFPSEMSFSFHKDKSLRSCRSNRDELKEYQSGGRKSNDSGESMASSASEYSIGGGSVSYGSFTTYEKIQKRSGRKEEEEMVTPVRRSSRIRNHQQSGQ